jgi:hypothetical protein
MQLKLSVIALASLLAVAACGDDDEPEDGSVKDSGGGPADDSGTETDSGAETGDAG